MPRESNNKLFMRYANKASLNDIKRNTKEALEWFRNIIRKDRVEFRQVQEKMRTARIEPGVMLTYTYDPKLKDKLPFYDSYPLIIVLNMTKDGWYGANIHYLPPRMRQQLFEDLNYKRKNMQSIVAALENSEMTKYCLKRYLARQVVSKVKHIPKEEWDIATFLPFEGFKKASNKAVWRHAK